MQTSNYWSATTIAGDTSLALNVHLGVGEVGTTGADKTNATDLHVWCVRGGQGFDGVQ